MQHPTTVAYSQNCSHHYENARRLPSQTHIRLEQDDKALDATTKHLTVDALDGTHGGLDVEGLDVVPVLLEKGDQEVDGDEDVLPQLGGVHDDVTDDNTETQDLLELEH